MVWEERFYAKPKDILSIRLKCRKCEGALIIPLTGDSDYIPESCPYCRESWLHSGSQDYNTIHHLIQSLKGLRQRSEKAQCDLYFELPGSLNVPG